MVRAAVMCAVAGEPLPPPLVLLILPEARRESDGDAHHDERRRDAARDAQHRAEVRRLHDH